MFILSIANRLNVMGVSVVQDDEWLIVGFLINEVKWYFYINQ
tara:strand:- start:23264 stop:23389 length:126 start_codon:yes stop_codon:yes gene_type:complete